MCNNNMVGNGNGTFPGTLFHCILCVTVLSEVSKLSCKLSLFNLQDFFSATKLIGRGFLITLKDII